MTGRPIESSVFVGVEDLRGEGSDVVLDRIVDEFGATGVTVAAAYHRARDLTPHGSPHVTIRRDGVHFVPDEDLFTGLRLQPPVQQGASEHPLRSLRRATSERGVGLSGWTVFCHNTTLGEAHPDCTTENAFGERGSPADLCPSQPDVRAYVLALARNVARLGVDEVVAEALHFGTFEHGYHHERSFIDSEISIDFCWAFAFANSAGISPTSGAWTPGRRGQRAAVRSMRFSTAASRVATT
jgi:hypothetical protein